MNVYTTHLQSFNFFFWDINKWWTDVFFPNQTTIFHCFFTSNTPDLEWETDRTVSLRYLAASLQYVCLAPKEGQIMASVSKSSWRATNCTSAVSSASVQGIGLLRRIGVPVTFIGETLRALFNQDWAAYLKNHIKRLLKFLGSCCDLKSPNNTKITWSWIMF